MSGTAINGNYIPLKKANAPSSLNVLTRMVVKESVDNCILTLIVSIGIALTQLQLPYNIY